MALLDEDLHTSPDQTFAQASSVNAHEKIRVIQQPNLCYIYQ